MLATAPRLHNRIAGHIAPVPIPVPATPEGKQAAWGDAIFAAVLFYQAQLAHPDERVAERAARAIFELEKTRLRHGREIAGTVANATAPMPPAEMAAARTEPEREWDEIAAEDEPEEAAQNVPEEEPAEFDERERAAIETMTRHERYVPVIEELRARLESEGVESNEARRLATEAFRQMVGEELRERRRRRAESGQRTQPPARREIPSGSACRAETVP